MNQTVDWTALNQRRLTQELERVRLLIERLEGDQEPSGEPGPDGILDDAGPAFALDVLVGLFGLSAFERDVVLLCAGVELDARFVSAIAAANGDAGRGLPTFGLALAALPAAHWSAVTPGGPLRAWRLVELAGSGTTTTCLRLDERVLHFLAGINQMDERLHGIVDLLPAGSSPGAGDDRVAEGIAAQMADGRGSAQLTGGDRYRRLAVAAATGGRLGAPVLRLRDEHLSGSATDRFALARLAAREARLTGGVLLLDAQPDANGTEVASFADTLEAPLLVTAAEPIAALAGLAPIFDLTPARHAERLARWEAAMGTSAAAYDGQLKAVAAQFDLDDSAVRMVAAQVEASSAREAPDDTSSVLWDACRLAARPRMDGLAQRIEAIAGWEDLVLPDSQLRTLRVIAMHVRRRHRVYEDWGFARKSARGLGITALFAGASGTGKTMAAEVLAQELRLDLYRIDLASVVSKYIGETEKNLKRLFDAAEGSGAILLFDEADSLFGKRSEVKDSHDRYANIEISYLLQRMEAYRGLAILTSNLKGALDPAFLRRIRFIVEFPFPDAEHRAAIWRGIFPVEMPVEELDFDHLAQLNVAGGHIRNIALAGAFLAADRIEPLAMSHLTEAAASEYAKVERPLTDAEIRGWA